jgi:hypothetical protein
MAAAILIGDAPASAMVISFSLSSADQGRISGIITHTPPTEAASFPYGVRRLQSPGSTAAVD